jgi:hypothetical protein
MHFIILQLILLTGTSAGWAYWLKRLLKIDSPWSLSLCTLLFGAGFAVQILILQNLVYCNFPIDSTFLIPAVIGLYGLFRLTKELLPLPRVDVKFAIAILLSIFFLQASTAFIESPAFYYGKGHTDQFNYANIAEFVLTQPFHSSPSDIHFQPWLTRAHEFKEMRIGQSVAQAYTAALSFSNAKEAYATLSSFCLALLALVTFSLARAIALPRNLAAIGAVWTGLAPALTRYHLEGFLSQTVTLFILPFLALWARTTTRQPGYAIAIPAVALAYLLVCYVELLPVGLAVFGSLALYRLFRSSARTIAPSAAAVFLSLALVPYAVVSSYRFMVIQLERAGQRHQTLEVQAALAGTIPGWIQGLVDFPFLTYPLQILTALALIVLAAVAAYKASARNRIFLIALLAPPLVILAYLFMQDPMAKYPFAKIQDSFVYVWVLLPLAGVSRLRTALRNFIPPARLVAVPAIFVLFAAAGTYRHHHPILRHAGGLQSLQAKEVVSAIQYAESHPGQTYLVKSTDPLVAGWLVYHARNSKVYLSPPRLADLSLNKNAHEFTRVPDHVPGMILLSDGGVRSQSTTGGVPTLDISNKQGQERDTNDVWYWMGDNMELEINRWDDDPRPVQCQLKMRIDPGPSHPSRYRRMRLTSSRTGLANIIETNAGQTPIVPIILAPGRNPFFLELLEPSQPTVILPHDTRKLMVRIINPSLGDPRPIDKPDLALASSLASGVPSLPQIVAANPQGEDKSGAGSWFWVKKRMELKINRSDADPADHLYQLSFRASAGFANPSPVRTLRLTHTETGTETILKVNGESSLDLSLNLKPGPNRLTLEIVEDLPHAVKVPGDPRVHMLRAEEFTLRFLRPNAPDKPAAKKKRL